MRQRAVGVAWQAIWLTTALKLLANFKSERYALLEPSVRRWQLIALAGFLVAALLLASPSSFLRSPLLGINGGGFSVRLLAAFLVTLGAGFFVLLNTAGGSEAGFFLCLAVVFLANDRVLRGLSPGEDRQLAAKGALWTMLLAAILWLYVLSSPASFGAWLGMFLLVGAVWLFLERRLSNSLRRFLLIGAAYVVGAEGLYVIALAAAGVPFGIFSFVLAAFGVTLLYLRRRWPLSARSRWLRFRYWAWSTTSALAAAVVVGISLTLWATLAGYIDRGILDVGEGQSLGAEHLQVPEVSVNAPERLARNFVPFILLTADERWRPSAIQHFLTDAVIIDERGSVHPARQLLSAKNRFPACAKPATTCEVFLPRCQYPSASCGEETQQQTEAVGVCRHAAGCVPGVESCRLPTYACADPDEAEKADPVLYAHVIPDPLRRAGVSPTALLRAPLRGLRVIVQYWAFFRYDDWKAWPRRAFHQWHDGDWESVSLGFSETEPLFAAFSSHCGGSWVRWSGVTKLPGVLNGSPYLDYREGPSARGHLLVFSGEGSHAMYNSSRPRPPDWSTCPGRDWPRLAWVATWGPSRSAAITEKLPDGGGYRRIDPRVEVISDNDSEQPAWVRFAGRWSAGDHLEIFWGKRFGRRDCAEACVGGPEGPAAKQEWKDPVGHIFCHPRWRPNGYCPPGASK
jgi:hypothetical protein